MVFRTSAAPDITESLPGPLSARLSSNYPPEAGWDVTFGPLGFALRPSASTPYERATEDSRKQQIDTSTSPGEQSLSSWWIRSQNSWDMGAGVNWYEPGTVSETVNRFGESFGVDVWTPGEVSLLRKMTAVASHSGTVHLSALEVGGNLGWVEAYDSTATWTPAGAGTATTVTLGGGNCTQPAAAGGAAWIGHDGGVSKFTPGSPVATPITCTGNARVWWVKARLIVAVANVLYEVPATGTGALPAGGKVIYTHADTNWRWSDVSETAGTILASGYSGGDSAVFRFTIDNDSTGTPVLSSGSQVTRTPPGERITAMAVYLGSTVVLGTSLGVRIGQVTDAGDLQYGPLTVSTAQPVLDVTFRDRFAYLTVSAAQPGGLSGAVRVDLSAQVGDSGTYAWAWDACTNTVDPATSLCLVGDRVFVASGTTVFGQSATDRVDRGWLSTGRIRYGTVEPKAFRLARMVVATNGGRAELTVLSPDGAEHRVVEFTDAFRTDDDVDVSVPGRPTMQYATFKVYLSAATAAPSATPVLSALSVKAVPAASRVRLYQFPLSCFDFEEDRYGNRRGMEGGAFLRLSALELLESKSAPIAIVDNRTGEAFVGQIDSVDFTSATPPSKSNHNFGGVATVRVRRL